METEVKCVKCWKTGDIINDDFFLSVDGILCVDCYRRLKKENGD